MRQYPIIAEINLDAFKHNINQFRNHIGPNKKLIAVVKANAYGHGLVDMAKCAISFGADSLAVARANEAIHLRKNDVFSSILLFGYSTDDEIEPLIVNNITLTVFDYAIARKISEVAKKLNRQAIVHIIMDTGMSRLGFVSKIETVDVIKKIIALPHIFVEGIYTHFADADNSDETYTLKQLESFKHVLELLDKNNINISVRHVANSAGTICFPEAHFDAVRPGIALYGLYPSEHVKDKGVDLKPVMKLKVKVAQVKTILKGTKVGYGCKFTANRNLRIATLPIGYADGFTRMLKNGEVLIKGQMAPVIGTICMDQCMIDIDHIKDVHIGDEVVIIGEQEGKLISAEDIAKKLQTVNYEVACMVSFRIPRKYK